MSTWNTPAYVSLTYYLICDDCEIDETLEVNTEDEAYDLGVRHNIQYHGATCPATWWHESVIQRKSGQAPYVAGTSPLRAKPCPICLQLPEHRDGIGRDIDT